MSPIDWLLNGNTGVSSKTICAVMNGCTYNYADVPHDPSDFERCYQLLALFPEWRARLHEVADQFPIWGPMIAAWDELTALYEEERKLGPSAPKLYARMRQLVDECRSATGWTKNGPGCWQKPGAAIVEVGRRTRDSHGR